MSELETIDSAKRAVEELWLKVLSDFDNETLHQKFIGYCTTTHQLPLAGEKYKSYREEKGDSPIIDKCMKKIQINAQFQYLPDRGKERDAVQKGRLSRLLTSALLLMAGFVLIVSWLSFPALRVFLLMIVLILVGYKIYSYFNTSK
ncbi:MAG: hypothetical protein KAR43_00235 [Deltaproteobacteria bacterium]|nr:hypothetical protein [Deltaproteobacteria bacterium]